MNGLRGIFKRKEPDRSGENINQKNDSGNLIRSKKYYSQQDLTSSAGGLNGFNRYGSLSRTTSQLELDYQYQHQDPTPAPPPPPPTRSLSRHRRKTETTRSDSRRLSTRRPSKVRESIPSNNSPVTMVDDLREDPEEDVPIVPVRTEKKQTNQ